MFRSSLSFLRGSVCAVCGCRRSPELVLSRTEECGVYDGDGLLVRISLEGLEGIQKVLAAASTLPLADTLRNLHLESSRSSTRDGAFGFLHVLRLLAARGKNVRVFLPRINLLCLKLGYYYTIGRVQARMHFCLTDGTSHHTTNGVQTHAHHTRRRTHTNTQMHSAHSSTQHSTAQPWRIQAPATHAETLTCARRTRRATVRYGLLLERLRPFQEVAFMETLL